MGLSKFKITWFLLGVLSLVHCKPRPSSALKQSSNTGVMAEEGSYFGFIAFNDESFKIATQIDIVRANQTVGQNDGTLIAMARSTLGGFYGHEYNTQFYTISGFDWSDHKISLPMEKDQRNSLTFGDGVFSTVNGLTYLKFSKVTSKFGPTGEATFILGDPHKEINPEVLKLYSNSTDAAQDRWILPKITGDFYSINPTSKIKSTAREADYRLQFIAVSSSNPEFASGNVLNGYSIQTMFNKRGPSFSTVVQSDGAGNSVYNFHQGTVEVSSTFPCKFQRNENPTEMSRGEKTIKIKLVNLICTIDNKIVTFVRNRENTDLDDLLSLPQKLYESRGLYNIYLSKHIKAHPEMAYLETRSFDINLLKLPSKISESESISIPQNLDTLGHEYSGYLFNENINSATRMSLDFTYTKSTDTFGLLFKTTLDGFSEKSSLGAPVNGQLNDYSFTFTPQKLAKTPADITFISAGDAIVKIRFWDENEVFGEWYSKRFGYGGPFHLKTGDLKNLMPWDHIKLPHDIVGEYRPFAKQANLSQMNLNLDRNTAPLVSTATPFQPSGTIYFQADNYANFSGGNFDPFTGILSFKVDRKTWIGRLTSIGMSGCLTLPTDGRGTPWSEFPVTHMFHMKLTPPIVK